MIANLLVSMLAFSGVQTRLPARSAVCMSAVSDFKAGIATLGFVASMAFLPAATEAMTYELPSSSMALSPNVVPRDLGDEPNKLKLGFRGLGLTTGFRSKKPEAKAFKAPASAKALKGSFGARKA
ncbi:hypothetical protein T492DRAFT_956857 [Pavlovales sp. CCMP2436]|nr:hypothetical protein T492DRAFT_956857 [Pavlovales sp. CCMP2436]|mmetsp:Transcript_37054/g.91810  ORF Transcript_37054/g.91810 Transcript_37054/m.91810 type:complete len:125 (+) Transcript_37054:44-418(+)|eukprot:CAMPEP_0179848898 /NCGR_PEP_ID=MMETSP0982-20121206/6870_1 /TAXON_ID=483367 /ORGANISM="non described non described, Strain CCMP 2436" /LENGTH=124 /DNA_ID=CAMNT_0021734197 /DNA_START=239 /DNA_END=613 /DNA_ORIENTATION=-